MTVPTSRGTFRIPGFTTQAGVTLDVEISWSTRGRPSQRGDNTILVLTSYAAQHDEALALAMPGDATEPADHFVIAIDMLGNGLSSSPSNTPAPFDGPRFPGMTIHDNVTCQRHVIDALGIARLRLVMGYSMGGLQAFEWGCRYPDRVDAILPICGAARVSPHNHLFLDGVKAALLADQSFAGGDYRSPPTTGLQAFGRVYAGWVASQAFFREAAYRDLGMATVEDVVQFVQSYFMRRDANDLLAMLRTWQHADISANDRFHGDFEAALRAITPRAIVMPCETDLYFTVEDSRIEVQHMPNAELRPIPSICGHLAGSGSDPIGRACIDRAIADLLG